MVGFGYDSHRFEEGKPLMIGGIKITDEFGCVSHSDGDTFIHALCDALLGAAGLGDIGEKFPDTDHIYEDYDSTLFLIEIVELIESHGFSIVNIDSTIVLEKPKLIEFKEQIRREISELCRIPMARVNVKAKTNEGMGFVGRLEGIAVYCICELKEKQ
ncbi:MAG: 2-C-methyl-D-erythritol 2,4-cyclodiphosphate synthase [Bacteroidota bacterium]|jgi:2-C-methyl-D-erythritol 2,4-cyclodiphosphate synthase